MYAHLFLFRPLSPFITVRQDFKWIVRQKLFTFKSFGVAAQNEGQLSFEITIVAKGGVKFEVSV